MVHESIHSIFYKAMGYGTDYFGISPRVGGRALSRIFPWISTNIEEVFGKAYLGVSSLPVVLPPAEDVASSLFPYIITPAGFLLMKKGKKSAFAAGAGIYIASAPLRHCMDTDFFRSATHIVGDNPGLAAACSAALAVGAYIGSKYAADGIRWLSGKIRKKGIFGEKLAGAKYYAAAAASAALLAFIAKPNLPARQSPAETKENRKMLNRLYNSQRYGEMLETGLEGRRGYEENFMLCYAQLVAKGKMDEGYAAERLSGKRRERFYIYLGLGLMHQKMYEEALCAVSKMPSTPENLEDINWAKRLIYSMHAQDIWIKGRNTSMGANPAEARTYLEEARRLYAKALSFETEKDPTLLKSIRGKIEDIRQRLEGID
jgi:tetratricopeptide (TPR) repeat protein